MKQKKRISAFVAAMALVCAFTLGVYASDVAQQITATLDPTVTVKLNGEVQTMTDANGKRVYPIMYEGTTYLPVRAVAGMAGLAVDWDQATRTAVLGKTAGNVDLLDTYKAYYLEGSQTSQRQSSEGKRTDISGVTYSHWLDIYLSERTREASFNVANKYDTLTFKYYSPKDAILRVMGDNDSILWEGTIKGGQVAQTATVPLLKTGELTFQAEVPGNSTWYYHVYIVDAYMS